TTSWKPILEQEFQKEYFAKIETFIQNQKNLGKTIFPKETDVFKAFNTTNFEETKVVILGQDPYHGLNQAEGLSFSVPVGEKIPPSLKNIYKEIKADLSFEIPQHGHLSSWVEQGVLLLNAILTVNAKEAASHKKAGWEIFTNQIIKQLSQKRENVVFLLWGNFAKQKKELIDETKHLVLTAAHPSPFSAYNGFFGCRHFSKTNAFLEQNKIKTIDWEIKDANNQKTLF
ncbi:MAG: uracil-DNA glycosylase, partial [Chitinophagales bacterium]